MAFIGGFILGTIAGLFIAALMNIAHESDKGE